MKIIASLVMAIVLMSCADTDVPDFPSNEDLPDTSSSSLGGSEVNSSSSAPAPEIGLLKDDRDGQEYKTVKIGNQTWMAKNLNFNDGSSVCYDNQNSYCDTYGRLYDWETARTACPNGWHLPSVAEWDVLINSVGGRSTAGRHLKATSGWNSYEGRSGNGLDTYGFAALPGGHGHPGGPFYSVGNFGKWWSSTEFGSGSAHGRYLDNYSESVGRSTSEKEDFLHSVRCLLD